MKEPVFRASSGDANVASVCDWSNPCGFQDTTFLYDIKKIHLIKMIELGTVNPMVVCCQFILWSCKSGLRIWLANI